MTDGTRTNDQAEAVARQLTEGQVKRKHHILPVAWEVCSLVFQRRSGEEIQREAVTPFLLAEVTKQNLDLRAARFGGPIARAVQLSSCQIQYRP